MKCFEESRKKEKLALELSRLGLGDVIAVGGSKLRIDTGITNVTIDDIEKIQNLANIVAITYSKNTGISVWVV